MFQSFLYFPNNKAFLPRSKEIISEEEKIKCELHLKRTRERFNRRLLRFKHSDSCMIDVDAHLDAYIISSPAIDAMILQVYEVQTHILLMFSIRFFFVNNNDNFSFSFPFFVFRTCSEWKGQTWRN